MKGERVIVQNCGHCSFYIDHICTKYKIFVSNVNSCMLGNQYFLDVRKIRTMQFMYLMKEEVCEVCGLETDCVDNVCFNCPR